MTTQPNTAHGRRRNGLGLARHAGSYGSGLVHVTTAIGELTLPIQSAALTGDQLPALIFGHVAAGAQSTIGSDVRDGGCCVESGVG